MNQKKQLSYSRAIGSTLANEPARSHLAALVAATHEPASALHFTPVQLRARIDGWSPERQRRYVAGIAATGRADRAAALCHATPQSAARLRHRPDAASFARACVAAFTFAKQFRRAEAEATRRARAHAERPAESSKVSKFPRAFSLRGCGLSGPEETSAPR